MLGMTSLAACGAATHEIPHARLGVRPSLMGDPAALEHGSYWQDVPLDLVAGTHGTALPAVEADVDRSLGASSKWASLADDAKERVLTVGLVISPARPFETSMGAYYNTLDAAHVPYVVTMDVFFSLARACLGAALDEAERAIMSPVVPRVLRGLLARLNSERPSARVDLAVGYDIARAVLAVAVSLVDSNLDIPPDLKTSVAYELGRIRSHSGVFDSKLLGRPLDYTVFDAQQGLVDNDSRLGFFRAVRWLGQAALVLARRSDGTHGIDVAEMRAQTRAALLVARAFKMDPSLAAAWSRMEDMLSVVYGPEDDLGIRELSRLAKNSAVDTMDAQALANVASIDRLRRAAITEVPAQVVDLGPFLRLTNESAPATFRLLGAAATPDATVLGQVVTPNVGKATSTTPSTLSQDGRRTLPSALDVGVLLGSNDARIALTETGDDAYEGFALALTKATDHRMPDDPAARHVSVVLSYLDAIATYLKTSAADATQPYETSAVHSRRKLAVALAAWAGLRHETVPYAHEVGTPRLEDASMSDVARAPSMIEPHPEAIAKLLATVRQLDGALTAKSAFSPDSRAKQALTQLESLLDDALTIAVSETACSPTKSAAIAWPKRIAAIEARLGISAASPRAAIVAGDSSGRVLEEGTGGIDETLILLRPPEPIAHASLFVGAHVPHFEVATTLRMTDRAWALKFETTPPSLPAYALPLGVVAKE